jgi:hypothetical protein
MPSNDFRRSSVRSRHRAGRLITALSLVRVGSFRGEIGQIMPSAETASDADLR